MLKREAQLIRFRELATGECETIALTIALIYCTATRFSIVADLTITAISILRLLSKFGGRQLQSERNAKVFICLIVVLTGKGSEKVISYKGWSITYTESICIIDNGITDAPSQ